MHAAPPHLLQELQQNALKIVMNGKGILAADESTGTIGKRFSPIQVENTEDNRRMYREVLFTAPPIPYSNSGENGGNDGMVGLKDVLGGVIMYEETLYQRTAGDDGKLFVDVLREQDILIGIKVDKGTSILPGTHGETTTSGLDGLSDRCARYYKDGARFAKWRSVLRINRELNEPSEVAVEENATVLARYAAICQQNGLVPIVEPEILMDGSHTLPEAVDVATRVLSGVYAKLALYGVYLEGTLLKPNMVSPGQECPIKSQYTAEDVARATVEVLRRTVPPAVAGITFLSGGQSEEEATVHLNAINVYAKQVSRGGVAPWSLTFSYGRALQATVLSLWKGAKGNVEKAQIALVERALCNSLAARGEYVPSTEKSGRSGGKGGESLYVKDYKY